MAQDQEDDAERVAKARAQVAQQLLWMGVSAALLVAGLAVVFNELGLFGQSSDADSEIAISDRIDAEPAASDPPRPAPRKPAPARESGELATMTVPAPPPLEQNLLPDPSFETTEPRDSGWRFHHARLDAQADWSTESSRSGNRSLMIRNGTRGKQGFPLWHTTEWLRVEPGHSYVFSAWMYTPDGGAASIGPHHRDANGTTIRWTSKGCRDGFPVPGRWERQTIVFIADLDPKVRYLQPRLMQCTLYLTGEPNTVFFDDVFFGAVDDRPCPDKQCEALKHALRWVPND